MDSPSEAAAEVLAEDGAFRASSSSSSPSRSHDFEPARIRVPLKNMQDQA